MNSADGIAFAPMVVEVRRFSAFRRLRTPPLRLAEPPPARRLRSTATAATAWGCCLGGRSAVRHCAISGRNPPQRSYFRASAREPLPRRVSRDDMRLRLRPAFGSAAPAPRQARSKTARARPGTAPARRDAPPRAAAAAAAGARSGRERAHARVRAGRLRLHLSVCSVPASGARAQRRSRAQLRAAATAVPGLACRRRLSRAARRKFEHAGRGHLTFAPRADACAPPAAAPRAANSSASWQGSARCAPTPTGCADRAAAAGAALRAHDALCQPLTPGVRRLRTRRARRRATGRPSSATWAVRRCAPAAPLPLSLR